MCAFRNNFEANEAAIMVTSCCFFSFDCSLNCVQDDVILGTLTVRENLMFSANMRLSKDIPQEEKERRVDETLRQLGLSHVANSKVSFASEIRPISCWFESEQLK